MGFGTECRRQVEFLEKLTRLLEEYDAQIGVCSDIAGDHTIELDACGTWIHGLKDIRRLDAVTCNMATREARNFAESLPVD